MVWQVVLIVLYFGGELGMAAARPRKATTAVRVYILAFSFEEFKFRRKERSCE